MSSFRALSVAILAIVFVLSGSAGAQSKPTPAETARKTFVPAFDLSPSGQRLAYARLEGDKVFLVVSDVAGEPKEAARLPLATNAVLHLRWLDEEHLLYSERQSDDLQVWANTGDSVLLLAHEPKFTVASANLETRTQLLTPKDRRGFPRGSDFVGKLPGNPHRVVLSGWGGRGPVRVLYSVSLNDGSYEVLDYGSRETLGWSMDGSGQPALRVDQDKRKTKLQVFAVKPNAGNLQWRQVGQYPIKKGSDLAPDFIPLTSGPSSNEVYVLARKAEGLHKGVYVFDVSKGTIVREVFEHNEQDVRSAILDESGRTVVAVVLDDARRSTVFLDPAKQKHMRGLEEFAGSDARIAVVDLSSDETVWLLSVESRELGQVLVRYDMPTAHASVLLNASGWIQ